MILFCVTLAIFNLGGIGVTTKFISEAKAAAALAFEYIDESEERGLHHGKDRASEKIKTISKAEITLADVEFSYAGGSPVFDKLSCTFSPGQLQVLVGDIDQGKTTLLHMML